MIKKAFFDMWDHLFRIFFLNFGCTLIIGAGAGVIQILRFHPLTFLLGILISGVILILYIGTVSMMTRDIADYQSPGFSDFFKYLKEVWKSALAFSGIIALQLVIVNFVIPWYVNNMRGLPGLAAISLLFWVSVLWLFASQFYFPIRSRLDPDVRKIIRKCLIIFFDNTLFTLVLGFGTLVLFLLSSFTAFLLPGIGTIMLWHQVGFKLRMYKYEYLEEHPQADRKRIPWNVLLHDDRERVGKRTLRGMIFPWKE